MKSDLIQIQNPRSKRYIKTDRARGRILGHKKTKGPYKGIKIVKNKD